MLSVCQTGGLVQGLSCQFLFLTPEAQTLCVFLVSLTVCQWRTQEFCSGGQQIQLRTEDRENGDLGAVAPYSGVPEAAVIW